MWNDFLNQVMPALITFLAIITTAFLGIAGKKINDFLAIKKQDAVNKIGVDAYDSTLKIAKSVYFIVEQAFRKQIGDFAEEKRQLFTQFIKERIPGITDADIEHFRQAVVGEINTMIKDAGKIIAGELQEYKPTDGDNP